MQLGVVVPHDGRQVAQLHADRRVAPPTEIARPPPQQRAQTQIGVRFVALHQEEGRGDVAHPLAVRQRRVRHRVRDEHRLQRHLLAGVREERVRAVGALDVLADERREHRDMSVARRHLQLPRGAEGVVPGQGAGTRTGGVRHVHGT